MKANGNFYQKIANYSVVCTLLATLFLIGCQKDKFNEIATEATASTALSIEAATIQAVYGIQSSEIDETEMKAMYTKLVSPLTTEQRNQLDDYVEQYFHQPTASIASNEVSFRSMSETIYPAGNLGDGFGVSVAKTGNTMFAGAPGKGRVYVYDGDAPVKILRSSIGGEGFGREIVASGDWVAISAIRQVFLFKKEGDSWVEKHIITPDLQFVAMSATGTDMAIDGNHFAILGRNGAQSVIFMYELKDGVWSEDQVIDLSAGDIFLWDIDISDGIIAGNGGTNAGFFISPKVYILQKSSGSWGVSSQIAFPPGYSLARTVAIDKSSIVATTAFVSNVGDVVTISREADSWSITGALVQPGPLPFLADRILDIEGSTVVVGVPTGGFFPAAGDVVDVFENGTYVETLTPSTGGMDYYYGTSVYIHNGEVGVGATGEADVDGNVFVYK